ncbi:MAG TPA: dihydroorotase family protein [Methylomirabilota bacterium]|nr:dihydroorotase family protein [Methylomirabilota bacterium]
MTTLIENARIFVNGFWVRANLVIESGKIESVGKRKITRFDEKIDARTGFVLPGLVDAHAHLHDPKFTNREDFTSGTAAAAAGGVTTVVEMVLSSPIDTPERVKTKISLGKRKSLIDFSLHAGMMNRGNMVHIGKIAKMGVRSFKTFMCKPYYVNDHTLMTLMRETNAQKSILNVHAEDEELANENLQRLMNKGRKDPLAHLEWKPNIVEERAIKKVIRWAEDLKARLHISHISTAEAVGMVRRAKGKRVNVTVETCPHYLTLTGKDMRKLGPYLKMNPSLKTGRDLIALWSGLRDGTVDLVTSEHAPGERSEKEIGWRDIWKAWGGVPTIETMLPVLLSEGVNKGRISMARLQQVICEKPARVFGLYPKKGTIRKGSDADLVIVDMKKKRTVRGSELHYKVGWTPYEGWRLQGWPRMTLRRGSVIFEEGQILAKPGEARFLPMFQ